MQFAGEQTDRLEKWEEAGRGWRGAGAAAGGGGLIAAPLALRLFEFEFEFMVSLGRRPREIDGRR